MKGKIVKKAAVLAMAGAILCTCVPVSIPAATTFAAPTTRADELTVSFVNDYAVVGEKLEAAVSGAADCTYEWFVNGKRTGDTNASYTPKESDLEKMITVEVNAAGKTASASMYCSNLPVIYIDTENNVPVTSKDDYIDATIRMQGNETYDPQDTTLYSGKTEIKGRGNSTWGMPKKPYKLKLDKSTNIMGMGKNKHWVLLANYSDPSLMRNTIAYDFSGELGMPHMETVWVDVVMNGTYVGNYQFCEHIRVSEDRVDIFDWESFAEDVASEIADAEGIEDSKDLEDLMAENLAWVTSGTVTYDGQTYQVEDYIDIPDITGGYLLELDEYFDEISKFKTNGNQPIMFNKPEFTNTNQDMMDYVQQYVQAFEDAVKADDYQAEYHGEDVHYSELFDFDALVDYWLINEIFYNEEINKKSTYMYKDLDGLMKMGPVWDMDYSSGGEGFTYRTDGWATRDFSANAQANMWYKYLIQDPYFVLKAQERYWEIRDMVEDIIKDGGTIDSSYELLKWSGAVNYSMWPYKAQNFQNGVSVFKTWMQTHINWLDEQFKTEKSALSSLSGYASAANLSFSLKDDQGEALKSDTVSEKAGASYLAEDGRDITMSLQTTAANAAKAQIYVNGILTDTQTLASGKTEYTISGSDLTAAAGEKDIIEVKILGANDQVISSGYVSLLETLKMDRIVKIEIQKPDKTEYVEGEALDLTGFAVYAVRESGDKEDVTDEATVSEFAGGIGKNVLTVSYQTFTGTITLIVKEKAEEPEKPQTVSTAVLEYAIGLTKDVSTEGVLAAVVEKYEQALGHANTILERAKAGEDDVTQEMVDQAWQDLVRIMQYFSFKECDKTDLEKVIALANEMAENLDSYLDDGKKAFTETLKAAKDVYDGGNATQDEVNKAWRALLESMAGMQLKPDKTALETLLNQAAGLKEENYEPASFAAFCAVVAEATAVYEDEQATAAEVSAAQENLEGSIVKLTSASAGDETDVNAGAADEQVSSETVTASVSDNTAQINTTSKTDSENVKSAKTGDGAPILLFGGLMAGAVLSMAGMRKTSKRRIRK